MWIGHIGRRLGLFQALRETPMTPKDLSTACGLYLPAVTAWCSAATAYGFLKSAKTGRLALAPGIADLFLDKTHPEYLGGQFSYVALRGLDYGGMESLFKNGRVWEMNTSFDAIEEATNWDHFALIRAIQNDSHLHASLTAGCELIDIGCGTGSLLAKLSERYPNSRFLGIDPSETAITHAMKKLKGKPVRLEKLSGEMLALSERFEMAYLGESLYAAEDKRTVLSNCYRALKEDGMLMVMEGLTSQKSSGEDDMLIMGMQLDFALQGFKFMTRKEMQQLLKQVGFAKIKFRHLGGRLYLVTALKP